MIKALPELELDSFETLMDFILAFYTGLGWDGSKHELDARRIEMHPEAWGEICGQVRKKWGIGASLMWMNYGPSGNEANPRKLDLKSIYIGKGAFQEVTGEVSSG